MFEEQKIEKVKQKQVEECTEPQITTLKELFLSFTANSSEMDGKIFAKLCKDCKIISKECSSTDVDLIFAQVKEKGARKITYA